MTRAIALVAVLSLFGCGGPPLLRVEPAAYYSHGYYLGSRGNVKVFVEGLAFVEEARGTVVAEVAVLNERPTTIRFHAGENGLALGDRRVGPVESQSILIPPGEIAHIVLSFPTGLEEFTRATLEVGGIEADAGQRLQFSAPVFAVDDEDSPTPAPQGRGNLRGA
jgi:hypothetical protein